MKNYQNGLPAGLPLDFNYGRGDPSVGINSSEKNALRGFRMLLYDLAYLSKQCMSGFFVYKSRAKFLIN